MPYDTRGPLVLGSLSTIGVGFCMVKSAIYRTPIGFANLTISLCGLVSAALNFAVHMDYSRVIHLRASIKVFSVIYNSLAFVPGIIVFRRIPKKLERKIGIWIAYFGSFLCFVFIVSGAVLYIITGSNSVLDSEGIYYFVNCGPIVVPVLFGGAMLKMDFKQLGRSLIAYIVLIIISEAVFLLHLYLDSSMISVITEYVMSLIFVTFTMNLTIMISVLYSHHWTFSDLTVKKVEEDQSTDSLLEA